jgi:hypothetical protein
MDEKSKDGVDMEVIEFDIGGGGGGDPGSPAQVLISSYSIMLK